MTNSFLAASLQKWLVLRCFSWLIFSWMRQDTSFRLQQEPLFAFLSALNRLLSRLQSIAQAWFHVIEHSSLNLLRRETGLMDKIFIVRKQTYFVVLRYFFWSGRMLMVLRHSFCFSFTSRRLLTFSRPFLRKANVNYRLLLSMK